MNLFNNSIKNSYYRGENLLKESILQNKSILDTVGIMYTLESLSVIEDIQRLQDMESLETGVYSFLKKDIRRKVLKYNNDPLRHILIEELKPYSKQIRIGSIKRSFHGLAPTDDNVGIDPIYDRYDLIVITDVVNKEETYIEYKILDKDLSDKGCDIYIKDIYNNYEELRKFGEGDYELINIISRHNLGNNKESEDYINSIYKIIFRDFNKTSTVNIYNDIDSEEMDILKFGIEKYIYEDIENYKDDIVLTYKFINKYMI